MVDVDGLLGALKTREEDELKKKVEHRVTLYTPPPPFPSSLTSSNHRSFLGQTLVLTWQFLMAPTLHPGTSRRELLCFPALVRFGHKGLPYQAKVVQVLACVDVLLQRKCVSGDMSGCVFGCGCLVLEAWIPNASLAFSCPEIVTQTKTRRGDNSTRSWKFDLNP